MFDAGIPDVRFSMGNRAAVTDRRWWDDAEPVWVTAEKAGMRTATMFWPGTETDVGGVRPTRWRDFDGDMAADARVDTVLGWLSDPAFAMPRFVTLYFDDVDHEGHGFGPDSDEVRAAVRLVDGALARLEAGLKARGLAADIVLVSDHGMAEISPERVVRLGTMLPAGSYRLVTAGSPAGIDAVPGREAEVAAALAVRRPHVECWPKAEVPKRFGFGTHRRVPAFLCLPDVGWQVLPDDYDLRGRRGAHGFDQNAPEMRSVFVAVGPGFRQGVRLADFDNVHVYPLLMGRLGLTPRESDGDARVLADAVK
jgi:predicted AlkP superfamily pyrophosphatase or phosphodiesterase